jgi:hypothetical protein
MARKLKPADAANHEGISAEDLKKLLDEASRQKALASEYQGHHGAVIKNGVERYGLEKNALTFVRRLRDMEEGKRQGVLRAVLDYSNKMGYFDQIDAFDDINQTMNAIAEKTQSNKDKASPGINGDVLMQLVG